jgi:hypothetical protein
MRVEGDKEFRIYCEDVESDDASEQGSEENLVP